jgi:SAM-dependent MidA family methyltransferase
VSAAASLPPEEAGAPGLVAEIAERIRRDGPLPFDAFMEAALHHPTHGYYTRGLPAGAADFRTSPQVHPAFGELVARAGIDMWARIGRPARFRWVELGPGDGALAAAALPALVEADHDGDYHLVEISPALRESQRRALAGLPGPASRRARWSDPDALASDPCDGVVIANEFFDALAVRRIRQRDGGLRELRVDWDERLGLHDREVPAETSLAAYLERYGAPLAEGTEAEVGFAALEWIDRIARMLRRGYAILIDYGDLAHGLFGGRRPAGTLLAYHRHRAGSAILRRVGLQDLTAHVNFTALARRAEERGLTPAPLRTQTEFLVAVGILDRLEAIDRRVAGEAARWRERLALKELFAPDRMGETFRVLVLAKDAPLDRLACLTAPWRAP